MVMIDNMSEYRKLTDEEKEQIRTIAKKKEERILKKRGITEYFYGEKSVFALNNKNADRKARNKGYL